MTDSLSVAVAVKKPVSVLGAGFMMSREVKALCERTGLGARAMYFRGRCGVLGDVDADVVTASMVFFPADGVRSAWEEGASLPAAEAAAGYAWACQEWGRRNYGAFPDAERLAELVGIVVNNADVVGVPLFAGWRAMPLPDDPPARLAQLMHTLRELRGGLHAVAVVSSGLAPLLATLSAYHEGAPAGHREGTAMAHFAGWPEPYPDVTPDVLALRAKVEELTGTLMAPAFDALDAKEAAELMDILGRIPIS
ncbi:SCO6745 family protein [Sinosporangium siamense]|uniref:Uncharacterized protein n=1 Tax=Sinosporangium siamense TaxID=1367973 RepID=A0A919R9L0_9ACTN|nr:hypothetical protein [Sinosporangium siamense]GII89920.1 hypothetical protein Ssi02_01510 [Sinosporangium siamense]